MVYGYPIMYCINYCLITHEQIFPHLRDPRGRCGHGGVWGGAGCVGGRPRTCRASFAAVDVAAVMRADRRPRTRARFSGTVNLAPPPAATATATHTHTRRVGGSGSRARCVRRRRLEIIETGSAKTFFIYTPDYSWNATGGITPSVRVGARGIAFCVLSRPLYPQSELDFFFSTAAAAAPVMSCPRLGKPQHAEHPLPRRRTRAVPSPSRRCVPCKRREDDRESDQEKGKN